MPRKTIKQIQMKTILTAKKINMSQDITKDDLNLSGTPIVFIDCFDNKDPRQRGVRITIGSAIKPNENHFYFDFLLDKNKASFMAKSILSLIEEDDYEKPQPEKVFRGDL